MSFQFNISTNLLSKTSVFSFTNLSNLNSNKFFFQSWSSFHTIKIFFDDIFRFSTFDQWDVWFIYAKKIHDNRHVMICQIRNEYISLICWHWIWFFFSNQRWTHLNHVYLNVAAQRRKMRKNIIIEIKFKWASLRAV